MQKPRPASALDWERVHDYSFFLAFLRVSGENSQGLSHLNAKGIKVGAKPDWEARCAKDSKRFLTLIGVSMTLTDLRPR